MRPWIIGARGIELVDDIIGIVPQGDPLKSLIGIFFCRIARRELRLQRQLPGVGDSEYACIQAGREMRVRIAVAPTPNPNFRRVDAVVEAVVDADTVRLISLSTVLGRF